jgi:protein-tyrosine phosphatase
MPAVLFVCTANRFRSPIAEAGFRELLRKQGVEKDWQVGSAGTWAQPDLAVLPSAEWAHTQLGLDLAAHRSRPVNRDLLAGQDLIIVMERNHREALGIDFPEIRARLFLLSAFTGGPVYDIPDPFQSDEFSETACLEVAQELLKLLQVSFEAICVQARRNEKGKEGT